MEQRHFLSIGKVAAGISPEIHVGHHGGKGHGGPSQSDVLFGQEQEPAGYEHDYHHNAHRGNNAPDPTLPKIGESKGAVWQVPNDQQRYQISRNDKKDIHPDLAAAQRHLCSIPLASALTSKSQDDAPGGFANCERPATARRARIFRRPPTNRASRRGRVPGLPCVFAARDLPPGAGWLRPARPHQAPW